MGRAAVPPCDQASGWGDPLVRCVPGEAAATFGVERAALQTCGEPACLGNVVLAGEPGGEPNLHRPRPAPHARWRAIFFSVPGPMPGAPAGSPEGRRWGSFRPARSPRWATSTSGAAGAETDQRPPVDHEATREPTDATPNKSLEILFQERR